MGQHVSILTFLSYEVAWVKALRGFCDDLVGRTPWSAADAPVGLVGCGYAALWGRLTVANLSANWQSAQNAGGLTTRRRMPSCPTEGTIGTAAIDDSIRRAYHKEPCIGFESKAPRIGRFSWLRS